MVSHSYGLNVLRDPAVISVIDDDAAIRIALDSFLRSYEYIVYTFASASEFLRSGCVDATSCVITDVRMPAMSGVELQSMLRRENCRIPFIFITAFPEEAVRLQAMKEGAFGFMTKPFDGPELIRSVEKALGSS